VALIRSFAIDLDDKPCLSDGGTVSVTPNGLIGVADTRAKGALAAGY